MFCILGENLVVIVLVGKTFNLENSNNSVSLIAVFQAMFTNSTVHYIVYVLMLSCDELDIQGERYQCYYGKRQQLQAEEDLPVRQISSSELT